jgi:hypothetical protein
MGEPNYDGGESEDCPEPGGWKIRARYVSPEVARETEADYFKQPNIDSNEPFWIIWNPSHHLPPTVRFSSRANAEKAAKTMARRFRTDVFFVLSAVGAAYAEETPVQFVPIKKGAK